MTTKELSKMLYLQHFTVNRILEKYRKHFERLGEIKIEKATPDKGTKGGRPLEFIILNEAQKDLLICLLKNSEKTVELKVDIIKKCYA